MSKDENADDWYEGFDQSHQRKYWYNSVTEESVWEMPSCLKKNEKVGVLELAEASAARNDPTKWIKGFDDANQRNYWFNTETEEAVWVCPPCLQDKEVQAHADAWIEGFDEQTQRIYYFNKITMQSVWEKPLCLRHKKTSSLSLTANKRDGFVRNEVQKLEHPEKSLSKHASNTLESNDDENTPNQKLDEKDNNREVKTSTKKVEDDNDEVETSKKKIEGDKISNTEKDAAADEVSEAQTESSDEVDKGAEGKKNTLGEADAENIDEKEEPKNKDRKDVKNRFEELKKRQNEEQVEAIPEDEITDMLSQGTLFDDSFKLGKDKNSLWSKVKKSKQLKQKTCSTVSRFQKLVVLAKSTWDNLDESSLARLVKKANNIKIAAAKEEQKKTRNKDLDLVDSNNIVQKDFYTFARTHYRKDAIKESMFSKGRKKVKIESLMKWDSGNGVLKEPLLKECLDVLSELFCEVNQLMVACLNPQKAKKISILSKGDGKTVPSAAVILPIISKFVARLQSTPALMHTEVFCDLIKFVTDNPNHKSVIVGWQLMAILCTIIHVSMRFRPYLQSFCEKHGEDEFREFPEKVRTYAKYCGMCLSVQHMLRKRINAPHPTEILGILERRPIYCCVRNFLNNKVYVAVDSWTTAGDVTEIVSHKLEIEDPDRFGIFVVLQPDEQSKEVLKYDYNETRLLENDEFIMDTVSKWQTDYDAWAEYEEGPPPLYVLAYKQRFFLDVDKEDDECIEIMYKETYYDIVNNRYEGVLEDNITMAALGIQIDFGDHGSTNIIGDNIDIKKYFPDGFFKSGQNTVEDIQSKVEKLYKQCRGFQKDDAMIEYVDTASRWLMYGTSRYVVHPTDEKRLPHKALLCVGPNALVVAKLNKDEEKTSNTGTLETIMVWKYKDVVTWGKSTDSFVITVAGNVHQRFCLRTKNYTEIDMLVKQYIAQLKIRQTSKYT